MRRAVVVLGMHRSGTSLLASLLQGLGVELGRDLLRDGVPDNEEGYWEHAGIVAAQEAILDAIGRNWFQAEGLLPLPDGWTSRTEIAPLRRRLADLVSAEIDAATGPWGFKDPRTVRLLPLWRELFAELGVRPDYVLAIRDPHAVAQSLTRRDGMSPATGQLLWLQHTLDAFAHAEGGIRAVVDYDEWFADPLRTARGLAERLALPAAGDEAALRAAIGARVRADLRHGRAGDPHALLPAVRGLWDALRAAAPDPPPAAAIASAQRALADAERLLGAWAEAIEGRAEVERARATLRMELAEREASLAAARGEAAQERHRADAFERDHADLRCRIEALHAEHVALGAEAMAAAHRHGEAMAAAEAAFNAERAELREARDRAQGALDAFAHETALAIERTWASSSLRLARPLQNAWRRLAGRAPVERPQPRDLAESVRALAALRDSLGWHMTGPLRAAALLLRRIRR
ncbi:MAG: hypothetical protein AB7O45_09285 [Alphaproteobacteria bacterium]